MMPVLPMRFYMGSHHIPFREITTNLILQMAMCEAKR